MPSQAQLLTIAEEDDLIQQTLGGDRDAFTPLLLKYKDSLFDLACRILGNRQDAEDVLQDAFLDAYRHLPGFDHRSRFSTWVYSIVLNRVRNHLRHNRVIRWTSLDLQASDGDEFKPPEMPDTAPSVQTVVDSHLELEAVQREVRMLPSRYQSIFILHYFQQMTLAEVAARLNRPIGTIKVYLHRARKLLFRRLSAASTKTRRKEMAAAPIARVVEDVTSFSSYGSYRVGVHREKAKR